MAESDLIQKLYGEIGRENSWYSWSVGILVTLIILVVGFYTVQQWKFSKKGIKHMKKKFKKEFKEEFRQEFKEDFRKEFKEEFRQDFKEEFKISEMDYTLAQMQDAQKVNEKLTSDLKGEINNSINTRLKIEASFMEDIGSVPQISSSNRLLQLRLILQDYAGKQIFTKSSITSTFILLTNGIAMANKNNYAGNKRFNEMLPEVQTLLENEVKSLALDDVRFDRFEKSVKKYYEKNGISEENKGSEM